LLQESICCKIEFFPVSKHLSILPQTKTKNYY
jgi:hypothetical protein